MSLHFLRTGDHYPMSDPFGAPRFETICAHHAEDPSKYLGAIVPPIFQNSIFELPDAETFTNRASSGRYEYSRVANPTTDILEAKLAALERTDAARCFGSGDAAIAAAIFHSVSAGDHIVAVETSYGPTRQILGEYLKKFNVSVTYVKGTCTQQFADAILPNTKLFYLESPSSIVFHLQNLREVRALAKAHGIITVADNSWASPYFQNPCEFGIDIVVHSATKYLGGHSDIVAGVLAGKQEHLSAIKELEGTLLGGILDPFASWLMLRGLRTLSVRLDRHQQSALAVARYLEDHPRIKNVNYPGLESHPQRELAKSQLRGSSGLLSFEFKDGTAEVSNKFVNALRYFRIAVSWGGYESLAIPISVPEGHRELEVVPTSKMSWGSRLHIGLENIDDILEDLDQALKK